MTGGKKRSIFFENGNSNKEEITAPGFLKNELRVAIKRGLPNTSSKENLNVFLRSIFVGIFFTEPRREVGKKGRPKHRSNQPQSHRQPPRQSSRNFQPVRTAPTRPPGPPTSPAPASQPRHRPSVKHRPVKSSQREETPSSPVEAGLSFIEQLRKTQNQNASFMRRQESVKRDSVDGNMNFLQTPAGGQAKIVRESIKGQFISKHFYQAFM